MKNLIVPPREEKLDDLLKTLQEHRECDFATATLIAWCDKDGDMTLAMDGKEVELGELLAYCWQELTGEAIDEDC